MERLISVEAVTCLVVTLEESPDSAIHFSGDTASLNALPRWHGDFPFAWLCCSRESERSVVPFGLTMTAMAFKPEGV
jgi:hypothetical protein